VSQTRGWIELGENRAARQAIQRVLECVSAQNSRRTINPVFVHGPAGCGKTHLVNELVSLLGQQRPDTVAYVQPAREVELADREEDEPGWKRADLVVFEDVQHLSERTAESFVGVVDRCLHRQQQLVLTATEGPAQLTRLPARLTSRLGQGLVVAIAPPGPDSRREFLRHRVRQRRLSMEPAILDWLAEHLPGSLRQLEGAFHRLDALAAGLGRTPTLADVQDAFQTDADIQRPTLERIVRRVGRFFQVDPVRLCSRRRSREVLLPRQVGMYLARQLTDLPLTEIGAYFGGRDHSTVLHACRKVEQSLDQDAWLTGAVRQLHADLA